MNPKSKNDTDHEYRLRTIKKCVAPTMRRHNPTKIRFGEAAIETQLFNHNEPADNVAQSKTGCKTNADKPNIMRRQELLELTSAERLRTQEFQWTTIKAEQKWRQHRANPPIKFRSTMWNSRKAHKWKLLRQ